MRQRHGVLTGLAGLIALYLAVPLGAFVWRALRAPTGFRQPGLFPSLVVTAAAASMATLLAALLGLPLAWRLARGHGALSRALNVLVHLPLALPPLMSGIILIYLVGPYSALGGLFHGALTDSFTGVVIAMLFVSAPFLIVAARAGFATLDAGQLDVAATLGHGELSRFWRVALPHSAPSIRAGVLLCWLRAFGEYGAVVVLAYHPTTLSIYAYNQFSGLGIANTVAPTALALGAAGVALGLSRVRRPRSRPDLEAPPRAPAPRATSELLDFSLVVRHGSFHLEATHHATSPRLAILGPSGSGKSTLLRALAGLEDGSARARVSPQVGYVAQGFALFPHLTVWQNLLFARGATAGLARHWLSRLHLEGLEARRPHELSGGQRQRVALAQALCASPHVLLLDEPFSGLDVPIRDTLRRELRALQRELGLSSVLVTHDPQEAAILADEVIVLAGGQVLQDAPTREVFGRPASAQVARLLGLANLESAHLDAEGQLLCGGVRVAQLADEQFGEQSGDVLWGIPPERVRVGARKPGRLEGIVEDVIDLGASVEYGVRLSPSLYLRARAMHPVRLAPGDPCGVKIPTQAITLWAAPTNVTS